MTVITTSRRDPVVCIRISLSLGCPGLISAGRPSPAFTARGRHRLRGLLRPGGALGYPGERRPERPLDEALLLG
jgi:hypothetical protein